jgi:ankyrin repeat protein
MEALKLLVNNSKIDLNSKDSQGLTPLSYLVRGKSTEAVRLLLENDKVDLNILSEAFSTPFRTAVFSANHKILRLILTSGKGDLTFGYEDEHHRFINTDEPCPLLFKELKWKLESRQNFRRYADRLDEESLAVLRRFVEEHPLAENQTLENVIDG